MNLAKRCTHWIFMIGGIALIAAMAAGCGAGGPALFSPWGNVVMYYGDFKIYPGFISLEKPFPERSRFRIYPAPYA